MGSSSSLAISGSARRRRRIAQQHVARARRARRGGRPSRSRPACRARGSTCSGSMPIASAIASASRPRRPSSARRGEFAEDDEREVEVRARRVGPARQALADQRRVGGDHRAEQHDDPAQVDPDQEDRHRRERAVDHRSRSAPAPKYQSAARLATADADGDEDAAEQRMAPAHVGVGHVVEQRRDADRLEQRTRASRQRRRRRAACRRPARATPRSRTTSRSG